MEGRTSEVVTILCWILFRSEESVAFEYTPHPKIQCPESLNLEKVCVWVGRVDKAREYGRGKDTNWTRTGDWSW